METDADLKRDVEAELAWEAVNVAGLKVGVRSGVVTLKGSVEAYSERCALERALQRINGASAIRLDLEVKLPPECRRSDEEILEAAQDALRWHVPALADEVRLSVDQGWLTLEGELDRAAQRKRVEEAMREVTGLLGLSNRITVYGGLSAAAFRRSQAALTF
ncbi:BON domain-containing protein [Azohydromonas caseinilytica]|uniref:BON domain-containing protein n=1 Tax=Azohydromonas caseinilytica TaxID=2728836 RepID=A0A848FJ32_9BURK|nr:BON domain-containing protein [Azohydromonas caseinilytica]NML18309.1 BON domain-containing protein [Azohydromonas caseinilytica]